MRIEMRSDGRGARDFLFKERYDNKNKRRDAKRVVERPDFLLWRYPLQAGDTMKVGQYPWES